MTKTKKKVKKKTRKQRSIENKAAFAAKRKAEAEARAEAKLKKKAIKKPAAKKPAAKKPAVEISDVDTKPWPRAGDNKEFQAILDEAAPPVEPKKQADEQKEQEERRLEIEDVAEWVTWPFTLWSQSQKLQPIITPEESVEIAKPLTRILNRHGVSEKIPPDLLDGMQVMGRAVPVIKRGSSMVQQERQKRAVAGPGKDAGPGPQAPQGAPQIKPKEV